MIPSLKLVHNRTIPVPFVASGCCFASGTEVNVCRGPVIFLVRALSCHHLKAILHQHLQSRFLYTIAINQSLLSSSPSSRLPSFFHLNSFFSSFFLFHLFFFFFSSLYLSLVSWILHLLLLYSSSSFASLFISHFLEIRKDPFALLPYPNSKFGEGLSAISDSPASMDPQVLASYL